MSVLIVENEQTGAEDGVAETEVRRRRSTGGLQ